ncbi:hypothetical protein DL765_009902 [Monosporascus sp. GIB2]|nr:hypothetical protein DL765_009902 [Monosporascus sp. GIB2]
MDQIARRPSSSDSLDDEEMVNLEEEADFKWPSDVDRFKALMLSRPGSTAAVTRSPTPVRVPLHIDLRAATPLSMGQHRVSSLAVLGASPAIEASLKSRDMTLGFKGLCHIYGLLIAGLWEEAVCDEDRGGALYTTLLGTQEAQEDHGQADDSEHQSCSSAKPPAPSSLPVAMPSSRPWRKASVRQIDFHVQQSAPGPSLGTVRQHAEKDVEKEPIMTRSGRLAVSRTAPKRLAEELSSSPEPESEPESNPGCASVPEPELRPRRKRSILGVDEQEDLQTCASSRGRPREAPPRPPRKSWTEEEDEFLRSAAASEKSTNDISTEMNKFGTERSAESDAVLKVVSEHHDTWAARLSTFQSATGRSRTVQCLTKRAKVLGLDLVTKRGKPWTEEEDKFLEHLLPIHDNWKDIYDEFQRKFGPNRTFIGVRARGASGSHPLRSHQRWTKEELDCLDSLSAPMNWKEIAQEFEKKFGYRRGQISLQSRMNYSKRESGIDKQDKYTEEEVSLLRELQAAGESWDTILSEFHRRFGPGRNLNALQTKWVKVRRSLAEAES